MVGSYGGQLRRPRLRLSAGHSPFLLPASLARKKIDARRAAGRAGRFEDGFCNFQGTFFPIGPARAERLAKRDTRPSIEERYPTKDPYLAASRAATRRFVGQGYLLKEDADLREAEEKGIRAAP